MVTASMTSSYTHQNCSGFVSTSYSLGPASLSRGRAFFMPTPFLSPLKTWTRCCYIVPLINQAKSNPLPGARMSHTELDAYTKEASWS